MSVRRDCHISFAPASPSLQALPDDILHNICKAVHDTADYQTLLAIQRSSQTGYRNATKFIYYDIHIKTERHWRSLLSVFESQQSCLRLVAQPDDCILHKTQPVLAVPLPNATSSQNRSVRAFTFAKSVMIDEFPSGFSCELAERARKIASGVTGGSLLFPSVGTLRVTAIAAHHYRHDYIIWRSRSRYHIPYVSKLNGLGTLLHPSHLCITRPSTPVDPSIEAGFQYVDFQSTRAFTFLVYCLHDVFPGIQAVSLHGIVPVLQEHFAFPRSDTRVFISAAGNSHDRHRDAVPVAINWLWETILSDHRRSHDTRRVLIREIIGWERLRGGLIPDSWAGEEVKRTLDMVIETIKGPLMSDGDLAPQMLDLIKIVGGRQTLAGVTFPETVEPCVSAINQA